jgi:hypothetical protein
MGVLVRRRPGALLRITGWLVALNGGPGGVGVVLADTAGRGPVAALVVAVGGVQWSWVRAARIMVRESPAVSASVSRC